MISYSDTYIVCRVVELSKTKKAYYKKFTSPIKNILNDSNFYVLQVSMYSIHIISVKYIAK